jgi:hypothetical protein
MACSSVDTFVGATRKGVPVYPHKLEAPHEVSFPGSNRLGSGAQQLRTKIAMGCSLGFVREARSTGREVLVAVSN